MSKEMVTVLVATRWLSKRIGKAKFQVNSMMTVSVTLLSIPVYRYRYTSETAWQDGQMIHLMAEQDDDGDVSRVRAVRQGQTWTITGPKARVQSQNHSILPITGILV